MDKIKVTIENQQKAVKIPTGVRLLIRRCCHAVLEREGFEVSWALQGLGELPAIRERYVRRAKGVCEGLI